MFKILKMKTFLLSIFGLLFFISNAQVPFVTTWEVTAGDLDITIPTNSEDYSYNYTIDLGDGTVLNNQTGNVTHTYALPGVYTVSISGVFPHFFNETIGTTNVLEPNEKLKSIDQWGDNQWQSMKSAFANYVDMVINAADTPDLSQVTDMSVMFFNCNSFNQNINNWDVSNVTNMSFLFRRADIYDQPLNNWDVSNVTNMFRTFDYALNFNQPLDNWDVSDVTDMTSLFGSADSFNQPLNNWDVSNVIIMSAMFKFTSNFNQSLDNWDVSNVISMSSMFDNASSFNQPLDNWDVSNVTNMSSIFNGTIVFNQSLNSWDVSNVIAMINMFNGATVFNEPLDNWDVSSVLDMRSMFANTNEFNQPIDNWDVSNVNDLHAMFTDAISFNQPLENWDIAGVTDLSYMFNGATAFNQNINNWNVENVNNMLNMFTNAVSYNEPLGNWDISNVNFGFGLLNMFWGATSFNQDLSSWMFSINYLSNFISNTNMSSENYDLLINKLVALNLNNNGTLGAANIEYCDAFTRQQLVNAGWTVTDAGQAADCNLNYVSGTVLYDIANNGCDPNDVNLSNYLINGNNGSEDASFVMDENGEYVIALDSGNYTLSILNLDSNFTSNPTTQTVSFSGENEIIEDIDFCVIANQQFEDLAIDIFPLEDAIPGFETYYQIIVSNNGTQIVPSLQVNFEYESNFQSFVSSTETPSGNTADLLTFDFDDLEPFSSEIFEITLLNVVPPFLNSGDVLNFSVQVTPDSNDATIVDNVTAYKQIVVNSFDPNDKMVVQGDEIVEEDIDQYLDYRIRFQNLGTANALNVKITDTIDNHLDWTTFQPITSSHDYRIEIVDGEQINYYFDNINLPFEAADEEGSNGYITYKIKPKPTAQIGDVIENTAYIYFDFNLQIITNTVTTNIVDVLDVNNFEAINIRVYPNPVKDLLYLDVPSSLKVNSVKLFDISGKLVQLFKNHNFLDLGSMRQGLYILKIETDKGDFNQKVIKR